MSTSLNTFLPVAKEAARLGGEVLKKYWGKLSSIETKSHATDLVTEADKESEALIIDHLQKHFPTHTVLGEESGLTPGDRSPYTWCIDPLDGTTNYTHQHPNVCVSIGLLKAGRPVLGVVYAPFFDELFCGIQDGGATMNGTPIHVSAVDTLQQSLLVTGFSCHRRSTDDNNYKEFCHLMTHCQGMRRSGSAALDFCYLAMGRVDGYWERGLKIWDVAAGIALIEAAGGLAVDYTNSPFIFDSSLSYSGEILATNKKIHTELYNEIHSVRASL